MSLQFPKFSVRTARNYNRFKICLGPINRVVFMQDAFSPSINKGSTYSFCNHGCCVTIKIVVQCHQTSKV